MYVFKRCLLVFLSGLKWNNSHAIVEASTVTILLVYSNELVVDFLLQHLGLDYRRRTIFFSFSFLSCPLETVSSVKL